MQANQETYLIPCINCASAREAVEASEAAREFAQGTGRKSCLRGDIHVECPLCQNTGQVLTAAGVELQRVLLANVEKRLERLYGKVMEMSGQCKDDVVLDESWPA